MEPVSGPEAIYRRTENAGVDQHSSGDER